MRVFVLFSALAMASASFGQSPQPDAPAKKENAAKPKKGAAAEVGSGVGTAAGGVAKGAGSAAAGVGKGAPPAMVEMEYCWANAPGATASKARLANCAAGFNMYESNRICKE